MKTTRRVDAAGRIVGLLVHEGEPSSDLAQAVELARDARDRDLLGLRG